ncbi:MAG TPA: RNA polymerase sigma factor [Streptosporangiaceae bacterium]
MMGDPADFEPFFRHCYQPLQRDLRSLGANRDEAEDAVSAGMLSALKNWCQVESPYAYVRTAALRHLIKGRQRGQLRIARRLVARGTVGRGREPVPDQVIWEQQEWVKEVLASLPEAQRAVLACAVDTLTPQETARLLGKSPDAVRQCLRAARERLRKELAETNGPKRRPADGEDI